MFAGLRPWPGKRAGAFVLAASARQLFWTAQGAQVVWAMRVKVRRHLATIQCYFLVTVSHTMYHRSKISQKKVTLK
jgi:hypothetical protein